MNIISNIPNEIPLSKAKLANLLLVEMNIGEKYVPFIFDTGAGMTVMNRTTAQLFDAVKLDETVHGTGNAGNRQEVDLYVVKNLQLGTALIESINVIVVEDDILEFGTDDGIELKANGFLGWDIIERFKWEFDSVRKIFTLEESRVKDKKLQGNMKGWDNMPLLNTEVSGEDKTFGFDSGNTESILGKDIYNSYLDGNMIEDEFVGVDGSKTEEVKLIKSIDIDINGFMITLKDVSALDRDIFPTSNLNVSGLLGADIFEGRNWILDYSNRYFSIL